MNFPHLVQGDCKSHGVLYQTGDFSWHLFIVTDAVALPVLFSCSQLVCDVPREPPRCGAAVHAEHVSQPLPSCRQGLELTDKQTKGQLF